MRIDSAIEVLTSGQDLTQSAFERAVDAATELPGGMSQRELALRIGIRAPWDLTAEQKSLLGIQPIDEEFGTVSNKVLAFRDAHPDIKI